MGNPFVRRVAPRGLLAVGFAVGLGLGAAEKARADVSAFELQVVALINQERTGLALPALITDARLFNAAEGHARWMADTNTFSHCGIGGTQCNGNGSSAGERAVAAGYLPNTWGEALAAGQESPEEVVLGRPCDGFCSTACVANRCDGWKQSPGHWSLLTAASFRHLGVGYVLDGSATDPYHHWWAVTVANSAGAPTPVGSETVTAVPSGTATSSRTPTATASATRTSTSVPSATASRTATGTSSATTVPSATPTSSRTSSPVPSSTPPSTNTSTATRTNPPPSATPPATPTTTAPSATPPATATASATPLGSGAVIVGHVRVQTRSVWGDTRILLDGVERTVTGDDGWFVILGVARGDHHLEARRPGALTSAGQFRVAPGVVTDVGESLLLLGDVFANNRIDLFDLLLLSAADGRCDGDASFQPWLDLNLDGCINEDDALYVNNNFGRVGPTRWSPVPAP